MGDYTESVPALEISDVMLQTMGIFRVCNVTRFYVTCNIMCILAYIGLARGSGEEFV